MDGEVRQPTRAKTDTATKKSESGSPKDTTSKTSIFDKLNPTARHVVVLAQEEAKARRHDYIGTEHLLLGLLQVESAAARVLHSLNINLEVVQQRINEVVRNRRGEISGHIYFTIRAKRAFQFSLTEAQQLGHDCIGAEHLLLGLIHDTESLAVQMLTEMGADMPRIRERVTQEHDPPDGLCRSAYKYPNTEHPQFGMWVDFYGLEEAVRRDVNGVGP